MSSRSRRLAIGGAAAMFATLASIEASCAQAADTLPRYRLEGVIVTTPRGPIDRTLATQRIDVVTAANADRIGATDVADALRSTTPVDVIAYPGLLTGASIRGFRPQISGINPRTLVLVDGRPAGTGNLALLPASGIERIEVQRGPGSALYGSSAMGGVINVITRRTTGDLRGRIESSYGSYGAYGGDLELGGAITARLDFDLGISATGQGSTYRTGEKRTFGGDHLVKLGADGVLSTLPRVPSDTLVRFTEFDARAGRARIGYTLADSWRLDLAAESFEADGVQNPGDLNPQEWDGRTVKDVSRYSLDVALTGELDRHAPLLRLFATREANDYFNAPESPHFVNFRTPTKVAGGQLQDVMRFGEHSLTIGADYTATVAESRAFSAADVPVAPYNPDSSIESAAVFAQSRLRLVESRLVLALGARLDRVRFEVRETPHLGGYAPDRESHPTLSPNAGARFGLRPWLQVYANLGKAFVTPEAFFVAGYREQRTGAGRGSVFVTRGNPDLRPETSWTWDAGIALLPGGGFDADLGFFRTAVSDRITTELQPSATPQLTAAGDTILSTTSYRNVDEARISGLEGRLSYDVGGILGLSPLARIFVTGTRILRADERFVESRTSRPILNVADLTLISGLEYDDRRRLSGTFSARYVGERVDTDYVAWWAPGTITYPAYLVLDLAAALRVGDRYTLGAQLRNLADEDYFEVRGYNLPGRSVRATVGIAF